MHGINSGLLSKQAACIGINLKEIFLPENAPNNVYDELIKDVLEKFKEEGITHSVYGDIFLEDLRQYRESRLEEVKMKGLFPLWKMPADRIMNEFIALGFKAVVTCVDEKRLDKSFAGREIDNSFLNDLPADVDICGENGEYHSFVYDGPVFKEPVPFKRGKIFHREYKHAANPPAGFWCMDLITEE